MAAQTLREKQRITTHLTLDCKLKNFQYSTAIEGKDTCTYAFKALCSSQMKSFSYIKNVTIQLKLIFGFENELCNSSAK